jgi:hypothetical protein
VAGTPPNFRHECDPNPDSCFWRNCATCPSSIRTDPDYADSPCHDVFGAPGDREKLRECLCREFLSDIPPDLGPDDIYPPPVLEWGDGGSDEDDPRLDLDDTEGKGPENINVRQPEAGTYRIGVHLWDPDGFDGATSTTAGEIEAHVRIFFNGAVIYPEDGDEGVILSGRNIQTNEHWDNEFWEIGEIDISYEGENPVADFTPFGSAEDPQVCAMEAAYCGCEDGLLYPDGECPPTN